MKKKYLLLMIVVLSVIFVGCSQGEAEASLDTEVEEVKEEAIEISTEPVEDCTLGKEKIDETETSEELESEEESTESEEVEEVYEGPIAPLTGLPIDESKVDNRVFAVMLDNHIGARPQAGMSQADIVYEILAEGTITRYMALFQSEYPENIGPVRSARPYFLKKAMEYHAFYTHVGGSPQGLADIKRLGAYDIDAMSCRGGTFWRVDHKKIPHNMYTSSDTIIKEAERKGYSLKESIETFNFYKEDTKINGEKGDIIKLRYKKPTGSDSIGYVSEYQYDENTEEYVRYTNHEPYTDENNNMVLTTKNILVQYANTRVIDNYGRREIDIVGTGKGLYFTRGEYVSVTWEKPGETSRTRYYLESGEEIQLNPGKTWIQVVPMSMTVEIEEGETNGL